jgi:hypothetical protein
MVEKQSTNVYLRCPMVKKYIRVEESGFETSTRGSKSYRHLAKEKYNVDNADV